MKNEHYSIQYTKSNIFREITYNKKVVGFVTLDPVIMEDNIKYTLTEAYIIPEYRGHNLLYELIEEHQNIAEIIFSIKSPNTSLMKVLLKNNLATNISDTIIFSTVHLDTEIGNIYTNKNLKKLYKIKINTEFNEGIVTSHYYTLETDSILFNDTEKIVAKHEDIPFISTPRSDDIRENKLRPKLKKLKQEDLTAMMFNAIANYEKVEEFMKE
ncbi:hypothetical protein [Methanosphaera sp. WGK6]|uniref:hypothetical protein n=1 Tax=Methanosphaera sp. WGK6 TaxID=1561964 RepID=UPI00084C6323|nr:hypothetical protein [Methanosphaera sp. WGK6]OED30332.1 hypothetical protein NL43_02840 [Methanosphaera sp. WGK6]